MPLYPRKRTLELSRVMSVLCQKQTLRRVAIEQPRSLVQTGYQHNIVNNDGSSHRSSLDSHRSSHSHRNHRSSHRSSHDGRLAASPLEPADTSRRLWPHPGRVRSTRAEILTTDRLAATTAAATAAQRREPRSRDFASSLLPLNDNREGRPPRQTIPRAQLSEAPENERPLN